MGRAQRAILVTVAILLALAMGCGGCGPDPGLAGSSFAPGQSKMIVRLPSISTRWSLISLIQLRLPSPMV